MPQDTLQSGNVAIEGVGPLASDGASAETNGVATLTDVFPGDLIEKLKALGRSEVATLSSTLMVAYRTLLYLYAGEEGSAGSPNANRLGAGAEALSGFFGTAGLSSDPTFRQLLRRIHSVTHGPAADQGYLSGPPLFQIRLALGIAPRPKSRLPGVDPRSFAIQEGTSQFDFAFSLVETPGGLSCTVQYATDLFEASTIQRFLGHFRTLLQAIAADPDLRVSTLPILTPEERQTLLVDRNHAGVSFAPEKCIHELVEAQAILTPENIALVFESKRLTYRELNSRANQLAHFLRKQGIGPETLVGMCMDRSLEMVIGIVGILKAGGAYLPLDITYPPDRLAFMIGDAKPPVVLTQERLVAQLPEHAARIVCLDRDWEIIAEEGTENPESGSRPENLAYVIYTSGSTGKPKGVQVTHHNVVRLFQATWDWYKFDERDVWTMFHSYAFDFSVWEIWGALFYGGRVVVVPYMVSRSPEDFYKLLHAEGVTVLNQTPSAFRQLIHAEESVGMRPLALRWVIFGGEALEMQSLKPWFDRHGDQAPKLVNMYGITETTVHVTYRPLSGNDTEGGSVIGCPIPDLQLYLLDQHRQPVPIGIPAEMYVGGAGVARGYLNRPELTAERFIPDPFSHVAGARLYKTGDLARFLPNGDIEYLGRIDHQVKIRGFRVELGEIEKTLESCPGIRQSVVVALDDPSGGKCLVGYVAARPEGENSPKPEVEELVTAERVSQWAMTFDETYGRAGRPGDAAFNIAGWNSSYTGQPIPSDEMQVWVEATVDRILALRPKRAWEIGCGTGLLLFRVAPGCERYHGTDISQTALDLIEKQLTRSQAKLPQVTLNRKAAHEVDRIASDYDTVILNSVMQYFPDLQYFTTVIEGAVRAVRPGGTIFIGDVRNFALLEMFHTSVQLYQAPDSLPSAELGRRIQTRISEEPELLIDPDFFVALQQRIPQISGVQIQLKRGRVHNELTRFRYDVFLKIGQPAVETADCAWLDWNKDALSLTKLRELLAQQQPEILGLTGVPDARLRDEVAAVGMLASDNLPATAGQIREKLKQFRATSVEPEDLWEVERDLPYQLEIRASREGSCNVLLRRTAPDGNAVFTSPARFPGDANDNRPWGTYANNPLQKTISHQMAAQLRRLLRARLPEYMVPSAFVLLDSIPLTGNGKVDRRALPAPDWSRPEARSDYVAPQTPVEETIAAIFADVMKLEQVGRNDHFFEIGGHSLSAAQVVSRLGHTLQVEVPLRCLFESPSVAALAQAVEGMQRNGRRAEMPAIVPSQKRLGLRLSIAQEALWYQNQVTPDSPAYNVPMLSRLQGDLDVAALEKAVAAVVERHELLRSVFLTTTGATLLFPVKKWRGTLSPVDLRHLSESAREAEARRLIKQESTRPFDLARDSMFRCLLIRVKDKEWLFLHNSPHIVFDGGSFAVLYRELASFYNAFVSGKAPQLPELPFQFADFAAWQRRCLQGEYLNSLIEYWKPQLSGAPRVDMPLDFPRPAVHQFRGARRFFAMSPELVSATNTFARSEGTTPFRCFYAAFNLFLHCYTGLKDVCVGSPVGPLNPACRGVENLIGYFVNTLVLRTDLSRDPTFREVIRRAEGVVDGAMAHSDLPFIKVVEALQLPRDPSRPVLFQVNFRAVNQIFPSWQLEGIAAEPSEYVDNGTSKFDLALEIESSTGRTCYFEYRTDLFREETILQMEQDYQALLQGLIAQPGVPISKLPAVIEVSQRIRNRPAAGKSV